MELRLFFTGVKIFTKKTLSLFLVIVILTINPGCKKKSANNESDEAVKQVLIKAQDLKKENYSHTLSFSGIVKPFERVDTGFKISGRINRIYFNESDYVQKGDKLATLEDDELSAFLRQAEASYLKAKNAYERSVKLLDDGTISPSEIESAEAEYKIKKASLDLSKVQLDNSTIFAPISGKLAFVNVKEKEVAKPNQAYFTIMNINDVIIEIGVPEYQITKLFEGQHATATLDVYHDIKITGAIFKVAIAADDFSRLFKVEVKFSNNQGLLKPGMIAKVEIETETFENIYLIPLNAILEQDNQKYVYFEKDGVARKKILQNYYLLNTHVIMADPVEDNARLIIKGHHLLKDGMNVYEQ